MRAMTGARQTAVVVEDSPTQALALAALLDEAGFASRVAPTLEAAVEMLDREAADVILLDLELPDASGLQGVQRLVRDFPAVPLVVVTAEPEPRRALDALQYGAEDYVHKGSMEPALLERSIRYAIERHRARDELRRLSASLADKATELERLNAEKDRMMAVVAHDLRNPLSVVRGYADFLLSGVGGELEDEQEEMLLTIRRTAQYMLRMVDDLLDFGRIQAGALELEREPTDLAELVREAVRTGGMLAQEKEIDVTSRITASLPEVRVDRHKVRQVVDNLLSNAVKFSNRGSTVEVALERAQDVATLIVRDRGVGIPAEDLGRVFDAFAKTGARPTGGERSTGLGLAIVRNIVEAHGGRIEVESEVGRGTTFRVTLPVVTSAPRA